MEQEVKKRQTLRLRAYCYVGVSPSLTAGVAVTIRAEFLLGDRYIAGLSDVFTGHSYHWEAHLLGPRVHDVRDGLL